MNRHDLPRTPTDAEAPETHPNIRESWSISGHAPSERGRVRYVRAWDVIAREYADGASLAALAQRHGGHPESIRLGLKCRGVALRPRGGANNWWGPKGRRAAA